MLPENPDTRSTRSPLKRRLDMGLEAEPVGIPEVDVDLDDLIVDDESDDSEE